MPEPPLDPRQTGAKRVYRVKSTDFRPEYRGIGYPCTQRVDFADTLRPRLATSLKILTCI
jgi:hypothetical protein